MTICLKCHCDAGAHAIIWIHGRGYQFDGHDPFVAGAGYEVADLMLSAALKHWGTPDAS